MPQSKHTPPETVKRLKHLFEQGLSNSQIESRMQITRTTLKRQRKAWAEERARKSGDSES